MTTDYYKILEVSKNASHDEIQKSYRRLARKYHPDMNQDDPKGSKEKFQKIQEAYDIIGNPEKRRFYDQTGVSPDQMGSGGGQGSYQWSFGSGPFRAANMGGSIDDILQMFTQGFSQDDAAGIRTPKRPKTGANIESELTIPFSVSINGGKVDKKMRRSNSSKEETVSIKIPAGTEHGQKIRLPGLGYSGQNGGKPGDLIITIHVEEHPHFKRSGQDLFLTVPITLTEAVFGGNIDIPTPKGTITLKVPKGSSSGKKLRVEGCGVPANKSTKKEQGDLYAVFSIILPETWSTEDEARIKALNTDINSIRTDLKL
jgi:DnaJ-class molecular chaperone